MGKFSLLVSCLRTMNRVNPWMIRMLEVSEGKVSAGKLVYRIDETPTDEELEKLGEEEQNIKGPDLYKSQWMK